MGTHRMILTFIYKHLIAGKFWKNVSNLGLGEVRIIFITYQNMPQIKIDKKKIQIDE